MGLTFRCRECGRNMDIAVKKTLAGGSRISFDCPNCGRMVNEVKEKIEVVI